MGTHTRALCLFVNPCFPFSGWPGEPRLLLSTFVQVPIYIQQSLNFLLATCFMDKPAETLQVAEMGSGMWEITRFP